MWATYLFLRNAGWMTVFTFSKVTLLSEYTSTFGGFILVQKGLTFLPGVLTASNGSRYGGTPSWFSIAFAPVVCDVTDTVLAEPSEQNESLLFESLLQATNQFPTLASATQLRGEAPEACKQYTCVSSNYNVPTTEASWKRYSCWGRNKTTAGRKETKRWKAKSGSDKGKGWMSIHMMRRTAEQTKKRR